MFNTIYNLVRPVIETKYQSKLWVLFRQHIQPWHPSSTLTHEAGAAVLKLAPEKFWAFSAVLFEHQKQFFDANVVNETRNETYKRLAAIAGSVDVDEQRVLDLLIVSDKPGKDDSLNNGNGVTNDIKLMVKVNRNISSQPVSCKLVVINIFFKANRVIGVHVSPTVCFNVSLPLRYFIYIRTYIQ
jgi:hypothetical protein